jgi:hypothetical protein
MPGQEDTERGRYYFAENRHPDRWSVIRINLSRDSSSKKEIINEVNATWLMSRREIEDDFNQYVVKLSDIEEFYDLDNFNIDGFELLRISLYSSGIEYDYVPVNPPESSLWADGSYVWSLGTDITISIHRMECPEKRATAPQTIEEFAGFKHNHVPIIKEGFAFFYHTGFNSIRGAIGDSWFRMNVPESIDIDGAIEIARRLVNTAELVDVQQELDVLRQARH